MEHRYVSSTSSSHVYIRCPLKTDPFDHYEMSLWAFSRFSLSVESSCCTVPRLQLSALAALYKENPPCCDGGPITQLQGNRNHFPNISVWWSTFASPLALLGSSVHPLANNNRSRFDSRGFLIKFASIKSNYIEHKDWTQFPWTRIRADWLTNMFCNWPTESIQSKDSGWIESTWYGIFPIELHGLETRDAGRTW